MTSVSVHLSATSSLPSVLALLLVSCPCGNSSVGPLPYDAGKPRENSKCLVAPARVALGCVTLPVDRSRVAPKGPSRGESPIHWVAMGPGQSHRVHFKVQDLPRRERQSDCCVLSRALGVKRGPFCILRAQRESHTHSPTCIQWGPCVRTIEAIFMLDKNHCLERWFLTCGLRPQGSHIR